MVSGIVVQEVRREIKGNASKPQAYFVGKWECRCLLASVHRSVSWDTFSTHQSLCGSITVDYPLVTPRKSCASLGIRCLTVSTRRSTKNSHICGFQNQCSHAYQSAPKWTKIQLNSIDYKLRLILPILCGRESWTTHYRCMLCALLVGWFAVYSSGGDLAPHGGTYPSKKGSLVLV